MNPQLRGCLFKHLQSNIGDSNGCLNNCVQLDVFCGSINLVIKRNFTSINTCEVCNMFNNQVCSVSGISSTSLFDELFGTSPFLLSEKSQKLMLWQTVMTMCTVCCLSWKGKMRTAGHHRKVSRKWYMKSSVTSQIWDNSGSTVPSACGRKQHKGKAIKLREEPIFFNQPVCNWQPSNFRTEVRPYVLYNNNKYMYESLISDCLFKHWQYPTDLRKIREKNGHMSKQL